MSMQTSTLECITDQRLAGVVGGGMKQAAKVAQKVGGKVLKKVLPPVNGAISAYDGYGAYKDARANNKGVGESLWEGTKTGVETFTGVDVLKEIVGSTPAY